MRNRKENEMEASSVSKKRKVWVILVPAIILLVLLCGTVVGFTVLGNNAEDKVLTQDLSESLGYATAAKFDFNIGTGNLTVDRLTGGEPLLACGTLQYLEGQGRPTGTLDMNGHLYTLTLKASGGRQPGFRLPWAACNGETDWQIHLNPNLPSDIIAYSGGGNVKLNLAGMVLTRLVADTGGGNVDVILPDHAANLYVTAKTGGGNVTVVVGSDITGGNTVSATSGAGKVVVRLPARVAALIHTTTGMGKVIVDSRFSQIDKNTYQSPDYDSAVDRVEILAKSGAGNVNVITK
jgi:hypothetical protein